MAAAARELREETGLVPVRWWALEQPASFYDVAHDRVRVVPVFVAEVAWTDPVELSHEHDRYAFLPLAKASARVLWATQRRAIAAIADEVLSGSPGGAAREVTARVAATGAAPAARAVPARRAGPAARRGRAAAATGPRRRAAARRAAR